MIEVVQAFDRTPIARLECDDRAALDRKIEAARRLFADRGAWLKTHQRMEILRKLAELMEGKREHLARQIAREGGKPLTDALIETDRAIDGVRNAVDELRVRGGREIPMGLTSASIDRRAFTIVEPIGAVAAISVQSPLESDRPSGCAGDRRGLPGDRQAGAGDAAFLHGFRASTP
jgi:acyl-CoA reductase-like NAD-dependent aldehyde dehydrogenase